MNAFNLVLSRYARSTNFKRSTHLIVLAVAAAVGLMACTTPSPTRSPAQNRSQAAKGQPKVMFIRPAPGALISRFDGNRNKGLDIAGNTGDPVVAAADGRVVYAGGQLRGYGNMIIVKHNETFLTAYAHNQTILVKENDVVLQNQKIAEMGKSETDRVKLHFEIRKNGIAVDPQPYLNGQSR